eukprot:SAG11_NODE_1298_length_5265_cov_3.096787_8_plen_155_part_00
MHLQQRAGELQGRQLQQPDLRPHRFRVAEELLPGVPCSANPVRWILTSSGYAVPPGAVQIGGGRVVARTLTANSNDGNVIPGFADTSDGKLATLMYDDNGDSAHRSNQWNATDFEIACCGNDTDCKPKPKRPAVYHHVRKTPSGLALVARASWW